MGWESLSNKRECGLERCLVRSRKRSNPQDYDLERRQNGLVRHDHCFQGWQIAHGHDEWERGERKEVQRQSGLRQGVEVRDRKSVTIHAIEWLTSTLASRALRPGRG